jgi:sugar phosphate isomerase/epimerase
MLKIGTTSFAWRYLLMDPRLAPPLTEIIPQARAAGVERLQICENARPLEQSPAQWNALRRCAADEGVELQVGCKTLSADMLERYMAMAATIPFAMVRVVLEEEDGRQPDRDEVLRFLDAAVPRLRAAGMRIAIENHFDIACADLAAWASPYPAEVVGFCVDSANSLRNFETAADVLRLLGSRALCYHLKDYRIVGSNVGFSVVGAPLGEGQFDVDGFLAAIRAKEAAPQLFLETWTPQSGDRERDVAMDAAWLRESVEYLRGRLRRQAAGTCG